MTIAARVRQFGLVVVAWFAARWSPRAAPAAAPVADAVDEVVVLPWVVPPADGFLRQPEVVLKKRPKRGGRLAEKSALWRFRENILDRLEEYFACLARLKRACPMDYELFSRIGLTVPYCYYNGFRSESDLGTERPSFGGMVVPTLGDHVQTPGKIFVSFVYFQKLAGPVGVQQVREGDVYRLTAVFDSRERRNSLVWGGACHVAVDATGGVRLLRQRVMEQAYVQPSARRRGGHRPDRIRIQQQRWRAPEWVAEMAIEQEQEPAAYITGLFRMAFETNQRVSDHILIRASRGCETATFGLELKTARTFFADRDATALAADGRRQRIFHYVAGHQRTLATGRVVAVQEHYRGARRFTWNGTDIVIVLPELARLHFEAPAHEVTDDDSREGMMPVAAVADELAKQQSA